jgi:signal transduction histidine kinase
MLDLAGWFGMPGCKRTIKRSMTPLRALIVESSEADAELLLHKLRRGGYDVSFTRVETAEALQEALACQPWDVVLSDYSMPSFSAPAALALTREVAGDVPFIIVSGTIGEEAAVAALKAGASDFLVKGQLARFLPALERELRDAEARRERARSQAMLEDQLRQAQKMEAVGQLAGGIAHDFNNLLTAILGYCELLTDQLGPDKRIGEDLREIMRAAERAAALTRQLLAFSRRQVLTVEPIDLNLVIRGMETMLTRLLGERIRIGTELAHGLPTVMADATQLEQVVLNLAVNARDAMPDGGDVTLRTRNLGAGVAGSDPDVPVWVELTVSDTGTGMSAETRSRIFEPFFTTKERGRGTGLGLAAVHGIVTQLHGSIGVESVVGQGTTFRIVLPATPLPASSATATAPIGRLPAGVGTVLVVEDQRGVRAFIKLALQRFGYRVLEADSAETALRLVEQTDHPIHLLLTDVVLPKMAGSELAERLRETVPGLPVLFMSGYTQDVSTAQGFLKPGVHLLEKPFTMHALLTKIRQLLEAEGFQLQR